MQTYTISQLAREFGLSRSTLLYYDRIGLLKAPHRTAAKYRRYTQREYERLGRICMFRSAGLAIEDVQKLLAGGDTHNVKILEKRLRELDVQFRSLWSQKRIIVALLKKTTGSAYGPDLDKKMWVQMFKAVKMDEASMSAWHAEFERRSPGAHHQFLLSLGISEEEALQIQKWSREAAPSLT